MTPEESKRFAEIETLIELLLTGHRAQLACDVDIQKLVAGLGLAVSNLSLRQKQFRDALESIVTSPLFPDEGLRRKIQGELWRQDLKHDQTTATIGEIQKSLNAQLDAFLKIVGPIIPPPSPAASSTGPIIPPPSPAASSTGPIIPPPSPTASSTPPAPPA
jgi:hypothetical protein